MTGDSNSFPGVRGTSVSGRGVEGWSTSGEGVWATSATGTAIVGSTPGSGTGVVGISATGDGIEGTGIRGVVGTSATFIGVMGISQSRHDAGVMGVNDIGWGVTGRSANNTGVSGESVTGVGVHGKGGLLAGFFEGGVKVLGEIFSQGPSAARFFGPVEVHGQTTLDGNVALNGTMTVQSGGDVVFADFAEHFDAVPGQTLEPGAVVVLTETGQIRPCESEYDTRVVGVVSGAGNYRPAMILDRGPEEPEHPPVALMGKVYCMADATDVPIRAGDLLTSSSRAGHAKSAGDRGRRTGAVIGKALKPLATGSGLIPILVTLQ